MVNNLEDDVICNAITRKCKLGIISQIVKGISLCPFEWYQSTIFKVLAHALCGLLMGLAKPTAISCCNEFVQELFNFQNEFITFPSARADVIKKSPKIFHEEQGSKCSRGD